MAGEAILVVDDNPMNLKILCYLLERQAYAVHVAVNADEAQATLERVRPSLMLMDIQLPGVDGLELTRRIRRDPELRTIPIIAVSANAMQGDERLALDAGCDAYVTKPIDVGSFPVLLAAHLSRGA